MKATSQWKKTCPASDASRLATISHLVQPAAATLSFINVPPALRMTISTLPPLVYRAQLWGTTSPPSALDPARRPSSPARLARLAGLIHPNLANRVPRLATTFRLPASAHAPMLRSNAQLVTRTLITHQRLPVSAATALDTIFPRSRQALARILPGCATWDTSTMTGIQPRHASCAPPPAISSQQAFMEDAQIPHLPAQPDASMTTRIPVRCALIAS